MIKYWKTKKGKVTKMEKYVLTTTIYHAKDDICFYGIALVDEFNGEYVLIEKYDDLIGDRDRVVKLIKECNELPKGSFSLLEKIDELFK